MKRKNVLLYLLIIPLLVLHEDFWTRHDPSLIFGIPAGMFYHVTYCLVTAGLMAVLVKWAWPFSDTASEEQS